MLDHLFHPLDTLLEWGLRHAIDTLKWVRSLQRVVVHKNFQDEPDEHEHSSEDDPTGGMSSRARFSQEPDGD